MRAFSFAWLYEAGRVGEHDGLNAIAQIELGEDVAAVGACGVLADDELCGGFLV